MIPAEAVEAAARALASQPYPLWMEQPYESAARAALEAAAPYMQGEAWDKGWDAFASFDSRPGGPYPENPYRK